uniref:Cytokinin receptor 1A n=1 Tax=Rhizophora mucronata TaxID=61149 RepID=A0A2P2JK44_RHIMU
MEIFQIRPQSLQSPKPHFMNPLFSKLNPRKFASFSSMAILNPYCTTTTTKEPLSLERSGSRNSELRVRAKVAAEAAQLKENWLGSLTCPFPHETRPSICGGGLDLAQTNAGSDWIIGIDPDLSGALAVLKCDQSGCSAQVFDSPHLKVMVGKRIRKRLDVKSIVHLLRGFNAPVGRTP